MECLGGEEEEAEGEETGGRDGEKKEAIVGMGGWLWDDFRELGVRW